MRRTRMTVAATALAGALLAGCGSSDGGGTGREGGSGGSAGAAPVKLAVPPEYDGARGWDQEIDWVSEDADADPVTTDGDTVAYIIRSGNGYVVQARDGATGKVRWTSAPYRTPVIDPDDVNAVQTPRLTTVRQGGRTYIVAWAIGEQPGDALTKSKQVTQITIFAADASGRSVAPLHRVSVPIDARRNQATVRDGGAGLLITWNRTEKHSAVVDMPTGTVRQYDNAGALLPHCSNCWNDSVVAVSPKGPVVTGASGGLDVPGAWSSKDNAPKGLSGEGNGTLVGVRGGMFVAHWRSNDGADAAVWSAHDLQSGRLLASTACDNGTRYDTYSAVMSPNGTYLAFGSVVFDVRSGKALCLAGDTTRRGIEIVALADDGTAYGVTDTETATKPVVELRVSTGSPKALPGGTLAPVATVSGGAVFTRREKGSGLRLSVRKKH
ncbi:hypothetical protein ACFSL4_23085 [Streptomyces caeni]|uniref:PQQ-like beta-propeller repeat protein n=1 Tax=Streptomyces caeni TaxID=2307231 RepID=A0ABW4IWI3_9ACTN